MPEQRFLLIEVTGPWTRVAVAGSWPERSRLDAGVSAALAAAAAAAGVRLLAIRRSDPGSELRQRPGRDDGRRVWGFADVSGGLGTGGPGAGGRGLVWGTWTDGARLLDLDLTAALPDLVAGAGRAGLTPVEADRPVALVCTHGGRDACCALLGRPVLAALAGRDDVAVWECSHVGGHRFAGNLLMLPSGLLYGRVDPASAGPVVAADAAGRMTLDLLRGRCGTSGPAQAGEQLARAAWGEDRQAAVRVAGTVPAGDGGWLVHLDRVTDAGRWTFVAELAVTLGRSGPASCGKPKTEEIRRYRLVTLTRTTRPA